jgi:hypothetical protein
LLDLPGLLVPLPNIGDALQPIEPAAEALKDALGEAANLFSPLESLFDSPPSGDE